MSFTALEAFEKILSTKYHILTLEGGRVPDNLFSLFFFNKDLQFANLVQNKN